MMSYIATGTIPTDAEIEAELESSYANPGYPIALGTAFASECFKIRDAIRVRANR